MTAFARNAVILSLLAVAMSVAGLAGVWVIDGAEAERLQFGLAELLLMLLLVVNGFAIKRWVFANAASQVARQLAWICILGLIFCLAGDVVNRNFAQLFYQHGLVVKHDYLIDSVWFFAPGYSLFIFAVWRLASDKGVSPRFFWVSTVIGAVLGLASFANMADFSAGDYVLGISGGYAALITVVGVSGLWLLKAYGAAIAPRLAYAVALGLLLATVADSLIGTFWIYGNNGQGYFPAISHINWMVYFASQALVQQLPLLAAKHP